MDINDLSKVLTNYDKTGMTWAQGDFNGDGTVDINDLSNVLTNYDKTVGVVRRRHQPPCPSRVRWPCWPRAWSVCWPTPGGSGSNQRRSIGSPLRTIAENVCWDDNLTVVPTAQRRCGRWSMCGSAQSLHSRFAIRLPQSAVHPAASMVGRGIKVPHGRDAMSHNWLPRRARRAARPRFSQVGFFAHRRRRFHAHRIAGGHHDHRHLDRAIAARRAGGKGGCTYYDLRQPTQTACLGLPAPRGAPGLPTCRRLGILLVRRSGPRLQQKAARRMALQPPSVHRATGVARPRDRRQGRRPRPDCHNCTARLHVSHAPPGRFSIRLCIRAYSYNLSPLPANVARADYAGSFGEILAGPNLGLAGRTGQPGARGFVDRQLLEYLRRLMHGRVLRSPHLQDCRDHGRHELYRARR